MFRGGYALVACPWRMIISFPQPCKPLPHPTLLSNSRTIGGVALAGHVSIFDYFSLYARKREKSARAHLCLCLLCSLCWPCIRISRSHILTRRDQLTSRQAQWPSRSSASTVKPASAFFFKKWTFLQLFLNGLS